MPIKKEEVQSGIFKAERISCSLNNSTKEELIETIKQSLQNIGLEPMLKSYENQAKKILEESGYPGDLDKLWKYDDKELPAQIYDLKRVLFRIEEVRKQLKQVKHSACRERAKWIAWNAVLGANAAMRANIRPIEPHVFRGIAVLDGAPKGGARPKKKLGIILAIKRVLEQEGHQISRKALWNYFQSNHNFEVGQPEMEVGDYWIYFHADRLVQQNISTGKEQSIGMYAFLKYVSDVRPVEKK